MASIINGDVCGYADPDYHISLEEALAHSIDNLERARQFRGDGQPTSDERLFFYLLQLYIQRNYSKTKGIPFRHFTPHVSDVSTLIDDIDALEKSLKDPLKFGGVSKCRREHEDIRQFLVELCDDWMSRTSPKTASVTV